MERRRTRTGSASEAHELTSPGAERHPLLRGEGTMKETTSDGGVAVLIGADAHHVFQRAHENFAVADTAGTRLARDGVDDFLDLVVAHDHFDFHLGHEIGDVFRAAIQLGVTLLPTDSSNLV